MPAASPLRAAALGLALLLASPAWGQDPVRPLSSLERMLERGEYSAAESEAARQVKRSAKDESATEVQVRALLELGRINDARAVAERGVKSNGNTLRLRLLAHEVAAKTGDVGRMQRLAQEMDKLGYREWIYQQPEDRVALGRAALLVGADPKRVLEQFFDPIQKANPNLRSVYLAKGDLALSKSDYALAAKIFSEGAKRFPGETPFLFGLARAFQPSNPKAMVEALTKLLQINGRHPGAHLLLAEAAIDADDLDAAEREIGQVLAVDYQHPSGHALRAVVARLRGNGANFEAAHAMALQRWGRDPEVEHLIGRKLSDKYRFAEGAERQRLALSFDGNYLPAKLQLAQDLLRLDQPEGWRLAEEVQKADAYDVVAYNLMTLKDRLATFQTLQSDHFTLRMDPVEAKIYGQRALALLERAHAQLVGKYGVQLPERTVVEIFPDQRDFAIRTFGLPGGQGYLGVCFGRLITANSPASRPGWSNNWEAVLWHEFAHVVTLTLTGNKMPRWLSEGISVYEERQAHGAWGEQMKPRYRAMLLNEDFVPLSQLSGAFLRPKTPIHLQFAYYESSLAVEFLMERAGMEALKRIFAELNAGLPLNDALAKHIAPLEQLDREFAERTQKLAREVAPQLDWTTPEPAIIANEQALQKWMQAHPNSLTTLQEQAQKAVKARQWEAAKAPLQKLIQLYPEQRDAGSAYAALAQVYRELKQPDAEWAQWQEVAKRSAEAPQAYQRLMELGTERKDWQAVIQWGEALAAVNPLTPALYQQVATAREALGQKAEATSALATYFTLEPIAPAALRFRQAKLLREQGRTEEARTELLTLLEEAPRHRAALRLLLEINDPGALKPTSAQP